MFRLFVGFFFYFFLNIVTIFLGVLSLFSWFALFLLHRYRDTISLDKSNLRFQGHLNYLLFNVPPFLLILPLFVRDINLDFFFFLFKIVYFCHLLLYKKKNSDLSFTRDEHARYSHIIILYTEIIHWLHSHIIRKKKKKKNEARNIMSAQVRLIKSC